MEISLFGFLAKLFDGEFGDLHLQWGLGKGENANKVVLRKNIIQFDIASLLGDLFELHERHVGVIQHGKDTRPVHSPIRF